MANKNLLKSKAVLKAISIGLAAMMAMTPVVGATDVYADDVDGNEGESGKSNISESQSESSENNTQSSENNTQAVEESYEQAKEELVPEIPQDATVTTDTTDGVTTETTEFTESTENTETDITVEKTTSEDGSSEDIKVTTDETTTEAETEYEYTYNNETVTVTKDEYAQKIADSKAGKDQDGKDLVFNQSEPLTEDILDELGNKIGVKTTVTEVATFIDKEGFETTKTVTTTVINYINPEIVAPDAPQPADPDRISLGEATDNSSSTAVLPDGTIIIETSEKKASAYKSEKSESEASTTVNNKVSEETVEIKSTGKKTEIISSFDSKDEAYKMLDTLEDKDKESVSVVQNDDGTFKLVKTVYVEVDEPKDITVQSGDGVAEFDNLVKKNYSESDGWDVKSETDETSGTTTWTVTKTNKEDVTIKYTYKFTPEKRNETAPESSVTTTAKTADEFAKNHLSEYTAENSGWDVLEKTDGNTTIWTISKKDGDTTTQYTYKFTATESTSAATKTSVKTNATTNEEFLAELKDTYKDGISNGSVTITDNNDGTYTVVKKGANSYETITETYTYSSSSVVTIPEVTAATWDEFKNAFEGNKNASIDESNKKCTVTTKSEDGTTTIITYTFSEGKPVTSEAETVTTTSLKASDFEAELKKQFAGWEFSDIDTKSKPGYAVWTVAKSENGTKTEYEYSFKYESEDAKPYTPTAKDEKSFKSELIANYGKANVSISSKKVDGVTTTTYTCTKEVDGLTQTYVYTSKTVAEKADESYTTATSVEEFKKLISEKYPGYNFVYDEKIHDKKGNAADKCTCTVTKDGKTVAIYEYWVSPDSRDNSGEHDLNGQTIDMFLKDTYKETDGWTVEKIDDNKWKASRPQNDNHTYVQIITLNDATPDEFTEEEISAWEKDIYNNHKESEGWTVTKDGNNNKWVAVKKFGKVTIDEVVYELTENGTTKSVTRKVEKSTLGEILGDEVFSKDAPVVNASNYQAYTLISAGDAIIACHENGGVYAGGEIGTKNEDGTFNKNGEVNIDDWFGAVLYDKDGTINLQNSDNQNRIERKKVDKPSDEIKKYWSGVADSVIESCSLATKKFIDGVYQVKGQIVANYDEWFKSVTINSWEKAFDKFMTALNDCGALLTGNTGFQTAQDGSGETGNSNLVIVSRTSDKITVSNCLGNLNLGLLLAPNADIEVASNNFTGTLIGNNIVNNAESHTNIRSEKITEEETKKTGKSVTVEQYKVNAKQKLAEMICTLSDPKVVANREKTEVSSTVGKAGITFSASMESSNVNASSKTDTITDSKLEKAKEGVKKDTISIEKKFEKSSSEKFGSKVTSKTTITNKKSVVILGKKVSETGTRVVTPPPTTPPVTPPPTTPPTTPPVTPPPTTPPVTPPSITPPTPVTPDTPTEGVLGERREVSPDAAVLGARRRVLGARRGVLGEKRVLGARTEDTSNAAGAVGVMLGSVALSGVWMTLRRKKKIQ